MRNKIEAPAWVENITKEKAIALVPRAQIAMFVMVGGGFLGRSYAEQPKTAYTDLRCGRLPYKSTDVKKAQVTLIALAERAGLDADSLPPIPNFGNMGVF